MARLLGYSNGVVMPAAPIPPAFERLGGRRFSFHPSILRVTSNEWTFRYATWCEVMVRNTANGLDLWLSRRFLGELSENDSPIVIVGLLETLEWRNGAVYPRRSRVIEMPANPDVSAQEIGKGDRSRLASVVSIRLEGKNESRASRMAGGAVALGVLGCLAVVGYSLPGGESHRRAVVSSLDKTYLALSGNDTYTTVIQGLGLPDRDRWMVTASGNRIRLLDYADRGFQAVLFSDRYVGAVDGRGRILQSVLLPQGALSTPILRDAYE